jgi:hypothetical protein
MFVNNLAVYHKRTIINFGCISTYCIEYMLNQITGAVAIHCQGSCLYAFICEHQVKCKQCTIIL